jgi:hypothetical protein
VRDTDARESGAVQERAGGVLFASLALGTAVLAAVLAGWAPLGFSIVTVFLFAGPHNWYEFRYFLSRMPARWGPRKGFYLLGIGGAVGLAGLFAAASLLVQAAAWSHEAWLTFSSVWNSLLVAWLAALLWLRGKESKGGDLTWVWAAALALCAVAWLFPAQWDLGLVYLHPLVALCFLQRELRRHRPAWLPAYYIVLATLPLLLGLLWWQLASTPNLPGDDALSLRITQHAGSGVLSGVSTHLLVATHTFFEMLHYGVWLVAIPLLTYRTLPWRLEGAPLAKPASPWRTAVRAAALAGGAAVLTLWACFLADYPTTRDVYFTLAMLHVLAEFPFLIGTV